jgi:hypothetical protein
MCGLKGSKAKIQRQELGLRLIVQENGQKEMLVHEESSERHRRDPEWKVLNLLYRKI